MIQFDLLDYLVCISCEPYQLSLRSDFGTSHSSTTTRTNALIRFALRPKDGEQILGVGEVGLPPKKPGCYLADYQDVADYFLEFTSDLEASLTSILPTLCSSAPTSSSSTTPLSIDPFPVSIFPSPYFDAARSSLTPSTPASSGFLICAALLSLLDHHPANRHLYARAAACGIELAVLDVWAKLLKLPMSMFLGLQSTGSCARKGFYTVGINPDIEKSLSVIANEAGATTRFFKIKVNADAEYVQRLLAALNEKYPWHEGDPQDWVLDANAAWQSEDALAFVKVLAPYCRRIYMVEQPWSIQFLDKEKTDQAATGEELSLELQRWQHVKSTYASELGIFLFADESVASFDDVELLLPFVHGVNIKLEKAGGLRGAMRAMLRAQQLQLKVWCGMMVGSTLACSAAGHLLALVTEGVDLDGSLLVTADSDLFRGGIQWPLPDFPFGYIGWVYQDEIDNSQYGIGVQIKI